MWSHAVGIVNANRVPTEHNGGKWLSEVPGTGSGLRWGSHRGVFTAMHVVEGAAVSDLRLYPRPSGKPELEKMERSGFVASELGAHLTICGWEDFAFIELPAETKFNVEFHDVYTKWLDPEIGQKLSAFGYPTDAAVVVKTEKVLSKPHEIKELQQKIWQTEVVQPPSNFRVAYTDPSPYNPEHHYLTHWRPAEDLNPYGFSGAAMWAIEVMEKPVSKVELFFAGLATHFYKSPSLERCTKASSVRKFLLETFGSPE